MKRELKLLLVAVAGAVSAGVSSVSFAQASGATVLDPTAIVSSISGEIPSVVTIGAAIIGVAVVVWSIKLVKGLIGR